AGSEVDVPDRLRPLELAQQRLRAGRRPGLTRFPAPRPARRIHEIGEMTLVEGIEQPAIPKQPAEVRDRHIFAAPGLEGIARAHDIAASREDLLLILPEELSHGRTHPRAIDRAGDRRDDRPDRVRQRARLLAERLHRPGIAFHALLRTLLPEIAPAGIEL